MGKTFLIILLTISSVIFDAKANNESQIVQEKLSIDFKEVNFKEVGSTKFSFLFWDIYHSTLYTKSGTYLAESEPAELIFEIKYLKDITAEDLIERTIEQWQHLGFSESQYNDFIPLLSVMWPDISSGDTLALLVQDRQSIFYFNDVKIGVIAQQEFSKLFLDIWLSKRTSQPELRSELLGEKVYE
jgi:hypothetical protein